jgi:hypothetical protein
VLSEHLRAFASLSMTSGQCRLHSTADNICTSAGIACHHRLELGALALALALVVAGAVTDVRCPWPCTFASGRAPS